ncbi:hypothetical protein PPYR_00035 [Photinus pyralis]|uniref:PiggyBac transposable element-derived protein domain-containing protein n=1 Tax=Photinus pyralis TaxID=7054 RepID=A0A5N4B0F1_PHOPY|nr:hypothetical protein PPYR_00035 [Photinus pyralis]
MSWEKQQEELRLLWEELNSVEELDDDELELATEDDVIEQRDTDSESEQDCDDDDENIPPEKIPRIPHFLGKNGSTKWRKHCIKKTCRTRRENIIVRLPGVRKYAKNALSEEECWSLFFTDAMLTEIVENTNLFIGNVSQNYTRTRAAKPTDLVEIKALFGLLYLAGTIKSSRLNTKEIWDREGTGVERFWATMSEQRFRFLLNCLRFDDLSTRDERKKIDKLAPIRTIFDRFVQNCKNAYCIGVNATIDEKLEAFRGRCGFKQYIPSKPNKYGVKIFALVDASTSYCANLEIYVGQQPEGPFRMNNSPSSVVLRLVEPISGTNRNLTCDNWFTSIPLVVELLKLHSITFVGTIKKNKRELPPEFVNTRNRDICTSMFGFQEDLTVVSYVPKKYKNVILVSSLHHDDAIDKLTQDKFKPEIITYYNSTKGGVDNLDKLCATYNVARNTRRWPMVVLYALLNIAGVNSQLIYAANNKQYSMIRRLYLKKLAIELTKPYLIRRSCETNVPRAVRDRRQEYAGTSSNFQPTEQITPGTRKRCFFCVKDSKTRFFCKKCNKFVCLSHLKALCEPCLDSIGNQ